MSNVGVANYIAALNNAHAVEAHSGFYIVSPNIVEWARWPTIKNKLKILCINICLEKYTPVRRVDNTL